MTPHLEDATLVGYLDRAIEGDEHESVALHLASCEACTTRFTTIRRRSVRLGQLLEATDVPVPTAPLHVPRRFVPSPRLAAAAVVLVLATVAIAVRPVRAWIVERSLAVWTLVTGDTEDLVLPEAVVPPPDPATTASVAFVPSGTQFSIRIARIQQDGVITVEAGTVAEVTAQVRGGNATEQLVVLPDGLRIVNTDESVADYEVVLPVTLREITIEVAGRVAARFMPVGRPSTWTVSLGIDAEQR